MTITRACYSPERNHQLSLYAPRSQSSGAICPHIPYVLKTLRPPTGYHSAPKD